MAVNKLDISMMEDVGISANQLIQRDGSGNLPAIDGSQLTGTADFTTSASDPVITTNPSGGVGSVWYNTTSGEAYICTDATAGENVWTNIGAGTGDIVPFQGWGADYGFASGGNTGTITDRIDRFSFASNTTATDWGNITVPSGAGRSRMSGHSSATHGFCSGGYTPTSDIIDKFPFASAGNAVDHGDLTEWTTRAAGTMSTTYGYTAAGKTAPAEYSNKIDKFAFSSNTTATDHGDVSVARNQVAGCTSHDYGFTCGGYNPSYNVIDKFAFSSNVTATDHGDLVIVNAGPFAGCQSETHGFVHGGVSYSNQMDKFAFSSNVTATDHGNLNLARMKHAGSSSNTHGFATGGNWDASSKTDAIDKFAFASTGNATDHGDLSVARDYLVGQQV